MESVRVRPAPPLRRYVAWYSGYRQDDGVPGTHRGLPGPYLTMIVTLDDPLELAVHPDARRAPSTYRTLVGGLHTTPALITHPGRQSGIQVALRPLGARALLGLPAGELAGIDLDAGEILPAARELHERVRAAGTWAQRFAVLDEVLSRPVPPHDPVSPEVARAWRRLLDSGGRAPVAGLAREVGWSARHLGGRFQTEIGLAPKAAARVVRFDRARRLLAGRAAALAASGGPLRLAALAAECGYFDQAHLARDFRALAGCSPTRWLADEFRFVQAVADLDPAGW
jgi:AraC-like DNA-binding protein